MSFTPQTFGEDVWAEHDRGAPPNWDVYTIGGFINVTPQLFADYNRQPVHGPPVPAKLALRRELGGHPVGRYRRAP